jgi:hypothetical protein
MNMQRTRSRFVAVVGIFAVMAIAASCAPPPPPAAQTWTFRGTQVTVNQSQDKTCVLGVCVNSSDEPYLINVGFRVKIGVPGSAQTQVANARSSAHQNVPEGGVRALTGAQQATITWPNLRPLDVIDLANPENALEVVGVYSWASEEDFVGNGAAADATATVLRDALNATLAQGSLPSDLSQILDLVLSNIFDALIIVAQNIPLFGLGDDVLGGGLFVGIGATGTLGSIVETAIGQAPAPTFNIPIVDLPPDIQGGGFFATVGAVGYTKDFTQSYSGAGGRHTYNYRAERTA